MMFPKAALFPLIIFIFCACASSRPVQQMSYAEAAFQAATIANAEASQGIIYQLAKDALLRARAAYRLKDFKNARTLATRCRRLSEEAEWKAKRAEVMPPSDLPLAPGNEFPKGGIKR